jgi:hypothetical protein
MQALWDFAVDIAMGALMVVLIIAITWLLGMDAEDE